MSNLTVEFQQMFLLVNRTNGATVLLPSELHTATLAGTMFPEPITLAGVDVIIRKDGLDLQSKATLRPGARYLPYLDYVFHAPVTPHSATTKGLVPPSLNARVILAGGYLTELPASDEKVADLEWQFIKPDGEVMLTQPLTDRVIFTLPLEADSKYELIIRDKGADQSYAIPADGATLVIKNGDQQKKRSIDGWHKLTEYVLLYSLTSASTLETMYPIPTAYTAGLGSDGQPICGGGQTDGDDDDPPPP
jgi:hypothetical protein